MKARTLVVCAVLTLVACGGSDDDGAAPPDDGGTTDPDTPGESPDAPDDAPDAPPIGPPDDPGDPSDAPDDPPDVPGDLPDTDGGDTPPIDADVCGESSDGARWRARTALGDRPVINGDNRVALIAQALAIYSGQAYHARLTTFPYLLDTASDRCDNDGTLVVDGDGSVTTARFSRCRIGDDTVDGRVSRSLVAEGVAARGNVRTHACTSVRFGSGAVMEVSGVHATGFETACCTPNDDFYTIDLDYRLRHPDGALVIEDATTRFRRVDWPRSARVEGSFTMEAPAASGRRIEVSTPEPLSREHGAAAVATAAARERLERDFSFASGSLRLRAEDGSELLLEALTDDASRARVTLLAGEESATSLLDWEPWRAALRWTPLAAYEFAGRPLDVIVGELVEALAGAPALRTTPDIERLGASVADTATASETLEDGTRELGGAITVPSRRVRHACALEGSVLIERADRSETPPGEERAFLFAGHDFERCGHALPDGEYRLDGGFVGRDGRERLSRSSREERSYRWDAFAFDMPDATRIEIDGEVASRELDAVSEESVWRGGALRHYRHHDADGVLVESIEDARFECSDARFGGGGLLRYAFDAAGTLATPATAGRSVTVVADPPFSEVRLPAAPSDPRNAPFEGRLEAVADDGAVLTLLAHPSRPGLRLVDYRLGGRAPDYVATRPMVTVPIFGSSSGSTSRESRC